MTTIKVVAPKKFIEAMKQYQIEKKERFKRYFEMIKKMKS